MNNNNLFASVALFRELYDNDKDIYDVLSDFILSAISYKKLWTFNESDINTFLKNTFEFNIPAAVIKTTLKNRLVKKGILEYQEGLYKILDADIINKYDATERIEFNTKQYNKVLDELKSYIEKKWKKKLSNLELDEIKTNLHSYLTDNGVSEKYLGIISSFIVENKKNNEFAKTLNSIKEGLILYNGIKYTSNLNELGVWNNKLVIYLDTEHLFNAIGYNGVFYKELFDDFYKLVKEINRKNNDAKIELKYFPEIKKEIDNFFYVAELITKKEASLDPSKSAMIDILNGCSSPSDVIAKKSKFYASIEKLNIVYDTKEYSIKADYNVVDNSIVDDVSKESEEKHRTVNKEDALQILRLFTKINTLRHGQSNLGFDKSKVILMSGKSLTLFLAHNKKIKFQETDVPFATDIDYITNKFWFKLKKGLSDKHYLPKTFDIITKAQIVLSNQINNSVSEKYEKLKADYENGKISKDEAEYSFHELRNKMKKPEDIVPDIIDTSLAFITNSSYEIFLQEQSILKNKAKEGEKAKEQLQKIKRERHLKLVSKEKKKIHFSFYCSTTLVNIFILLILVSLGYAIYKLVSPNDTKLSIISFILSIGLFVFGYYKYYKIIINKIWNGYKNKYKKKLLKIKTDAQQWL